MATYQFTNVYRVNTATTPAGKEANSLDFVFTSLGSPSINDSTNSSLFSGNDVCAIGLNINGNTYYGWISRPIKVGGQVKGFYFWTDSDFETLAAAQNDGNQDGDSNVADNLGFILVVDQSYFNGLGLTAGAIGNVGSSSDRVDTALNSLIPTNVAPAGVADTVTAVEAGGASNATAGTNPTGNVTTNDTDANSGDTKTVTKVGTTTAGTLVAASSTSSSNATSVTGTYGTLAIGADGSYSYTVSNSNPTVEGLRTTSNTLTDTFTYTVADNKGLTSTTTLVVTIQGKNDNPTAVNDYNTAKESIAGSGNYTGTDTSGALATGNVLTNDTDKDSGDGKTITGTTMSSIGTASSSSSTGSTSVTFTSAAGGVGGTDAMYYEVSATDFRLMYAVDQTTIVRVASGSGTNVTLNAIPAYYYDASEPGQRKAVSNLSGEFGFKNSNNPPTTDGGGGNLKLATISATTTTGTTSITFSSFTGTVAVGMDVSGTNIPANSHVSSVTYTSGVVTGVVLDTVASGTVSGTVTVSSTTSSGVTMTGGFGTLLLNADGTYTYTPTISNANISQNQTVTETFTYTMQDTSGATSSANLVITVRGSGTTDPNAVSDTATAVEAGGTSNGTAGTNPTGSLLTNDTVGGGTTPITVVSARAASGSTDTTATAGGVDIAGLYGTLNVKTDGTYTYTVDNSNATVNALASSASTFADTFVYTMQNASSGNPNDTATLTVTIQGANDAPVAVNDVALATEAGGFANATAGYNPTGNVLTNDTDVDTGATQTVSAVHTGSVEGSGTPGTVGSALTGTYGSLTLNSNGTYTYTVDNSNATVNGLAAGVTLTDSFNYTVSDGSLTDIATLTVTVTGATDTLTVNDVYVNEASAFANFTVTGTAGMPVTLALADTEASGLASTDTAATLGSDLSNQIQYFVTGTGWTNYTSGSVSLPTGGLMYVRVAITNDTVHEGNESFTLTATTTSSDVTSDYGVGTIGDEGSGDVFLLTNNTGTADSAGTNDDRPTISITSPTVTEGGAPQFTVSLSNTSTQTISFRPTVTSGTATVGTDTAAGTALEVSTNGGSNWSTMSGAVSIAAGSSSVMLQIATVDDASVEGTEAFTVGTGYINGTVTSLIGVTGTATITDNDSAPTLAIDDVTVNEAAGTATFTVTRSGATGATASVAYTTADGTASSGAGNDYSAATGTLSFAAGEASKTFAVSILNDDVYEGSQSFTVNLSDAVGATIADSQGVGTIEDNDTAGLTVTGTSLTTSETGTTATFTARLNSQPVNDVVVTLTGWDATEGSLSTSTLTFTAANWNTAQTVTVTGADDALVDGDVGYTLTAATSGDAAYDGANSRTGTVTVTNTDNDTAGITLSQASLTTSEAGSTASFTVKLNTQPVNDVIVTLTGLDASEGSLNAGTLTFTAANWSTAQTVTVTGVDDALVDGDIAYTLTAATSGDAAYDGANSRTGTVTVTNIDNDIAGITLSQAALTTGEAGSTASFTVKLNTQPVNDVVVTLTGLDATEGSLSTSTLTFTAANWNTAQTVTVTGVDDALVDGDIGYTLTAATSGDAAYDGANSRTGTVTVTNTDNDTAGITLSQATLTTGEAGSTASFTVKLNTQPVNDVIVTLTGLDGSEGSLSTSTLTFTAANWNTAQTVTVTGADDALVDGDIGYTLTAATSGDAAYDGANSRTGTVAVTNTDNDTAGITLSQATLTTGEAGSTASFTVKLNTQPVNDVIVTLTGLDGSEGSLSTSTLTFTAANWNTAQTVTVTGADDALVDGDIGYTLTAATSGDAAYDGANSKSGTVAITNTDDDAAGITLSQATLTTSEAGSTATFTVKLNTQPVNDVVVTLTGLDATEGSLSTSTLTFTAANWNTAQTVTVTGADDALVDGDIAFTLTAATSGDAAYDGANSRTGTVAVTNTDNDIAGITLSQAALTTGEAGSTASFTVKLNTQPVNDVIVTLTGLDASEGSLSTSTLTFTAANWNTAQTVTVTGADDALVDGDIGYTLTAATSGDATYDGANSKSGTVAVTNTDNDTAGITLSQASLTTSEAGSTASFTVKLNTQPVNDVIVTLTGLDASEGSLNAGTLTFTAANWSTAQTVTVTGVDDALVDGDIAYTLTAATSGDAAYDGANSRTGTVTVTNTDNDTAGITLSQAALTTGEAGSTASFTVKLNTQPVNDVVVTLTGLDATEGSLSTSTLTFTAANWNTAQTVTVTGVDDALVDGDIGYTLTAATSGDAAYDGANSRTGTVAVTNTDNDTAGITLSQATLTTGEAGSTASFTVKLNTQPVNDVVITLTGLDASEGSLSAGTLIFTAANWNSAQTVTVSGLDDALVDGDIGYTLTLASSGDSAYAGANSQSAAVAVTNQDDDQAGLTLSQTTLTTDEGGTSASFTVKLASQPVADVTVAITGLDASEGSLSAGTLTFTAANWNSAQTVTVSGLDDALVDGDIGYTLTLASSGDSAYAGANSQSATVAVTNQDNYLAPPPPPVVIAADLDPDSDDGPSNEDGITSIIEPEFTISAAGLLAVGQTVQLVAPDGRIVGTNRVTAQDVAAGEVDVPSGPLDDGIYAFTAQILDPTGRLVGQGDVTVTIITDRDGVQPSVELAANDGDFNGDGIFDWQQNNLAQLPIGSISDFLAGKNAPAASFGAIMVGILDASNPTGPVHLDATAQLLNISLAELPAPLPSDMQQATPVFNFSVTFQQGAVLQDMDSVRAGLQTRVVIDLPAGVLADSFIKWDQATASWFEFLDDGDLSTYDDGATLLDFENDGKVDRVVLTLTDGGPGDADGLANGIVVDPGLLVLKVKPDPVYSVLLANGDRFYTTDAHEAGQMAKGTSNVFEGASFDSLDTAAGGRQLSANYHLFTADWYFAADGDPMPYMCYAAMPGAGFQAAAPSQGPGADFHLFMDVNGITQLVTLAQAGSLSLSSAGFIDRGSIFNTTTSSAFIFDVEGYLVANQGNQGVQNLVLSLANTYLSTADAGFIEAVEQHYLAQIELVGLAHGEAATAMDVNAAFGTMFSS